MTQNVSGWLPNLIGPVVLADEGTAVPSRPMINFTGAGVVVTDDPVNGRTNVAVTAGGGSSLPVNRAIVEKTANYTLVPSTDHTVVFTGAGTLTAQLPGSPTAGDEFVIVNATSNVLTVDTNGNSCLPNLTSSTSLAVGQANTFTKSTTAHWIVT